MFENKMDHDFLFYATSWATDRLLEATSPEEMELISQNLTLKLKQHILDNPCFLDTTHCEDSLSEEEKHSAAKRYEEHVNHACSLALATVAVLAENSSSDVCEKDE
jgi:hypothetical protein